MEQIYFAIPTDVGRRKLLEHAIANTAMKITEYAVGDANGVAYKPTGDMTALKNQKWRGKTTKVEVPSLSTNELYIESFIDKSVGPFAIMEMAAFDEDGDMVAIANTPVTEKPHPDSGAAIAIHPNMTLVLDTTENITITVDVVNEKEIQQAIENHDKNKEAHPILLSELKKKLDKQTVAKREIPIDSSFWFSRGNWMWKNAFNEVSVSVATHTNSDNVYIEPRKKYIIGILPEGYRPEYTIECTATLRSAGVEGYEPNSAVVAINKDTGEISVTTPNVNDKQWRVLIFDISYPALGVSK